MKKVKETNNMTKVTYALFQTAIFIPGIGSIGNTFPATMKAFNEMQVHDDGHCLVITYKHITAKIPHTNVQIFLVSNESKQDSTGTPVVTKLAKAHA